MNSNSLVDVLAARAIFGASGSADRVRALRLGRTSSYRTRLTRVGSVGLRDDHALSAQVNAGNLAAEQVEPDLVIEGQMCPDGRDLLKAQRKIDRLDFDRRQFLDGDREVRGDIYPVAGRDGDVEISIQIDVQAHPKGEARGNFDTHAHSPFRKRSISVRRMSSHANPDFRCPPSGSGLRSENFKLTYCSLREMISQLLSLQKTSACVIPMLPFADSV